MCINERITSQIEWIFLYSLKLRNVNFVANRVATPQADTQVIKNCEQRGMSLQQEFLYLLGLVWQL